MVLKGKIASGFKGSMLRSILVVGQFVISIGLIISTIVIYNQLNYIRNREIGFDRDQVLVIHNAYLAGDPVKTFRKELTQTDRCRRCHPVRRPPDPGERL